MQYVQEIDGDIEDEFVFNIFITDENYEVDLSDLMRVATAADITSLTYMDGYIFFYTVFESKINAWKKHLLIRDVITEVLYAKIDKFHKFVLFDDLYGLCKLIDSGKEIESHGESTVLISLIDTPDWITSEIHKKLEKDGKI